MNASAFDSFDPAPYQRLPNAPLRTVVTVTRALLELFEPGLDARVDKAAKRLEAEVVGCEAALTELHRDEAEPAYGTVFGFDGATDSLWAMVGAALERDSGYDHPGFDPYVDRPDSPLGKLVRAGRARAARRRELGRRLFGDQGTGFLSLPVREQGQTSAAILRMIDEDGLGEAFTKLVGADLLSAIELAQVEYEAMLVDRYSQPATTRENLTRARRRLSRQILRYANTVLATLDEDEPDSLERIERALAPIVRLRAELAARRGGGVTDEGEGEASEAQDSEAAEDEGGGGGEPDLDV